MSDFRLQVIHVPTGEVVHGWGPGSTLELDLVKELVERVNSKPIGILGISTKGAICKHVEEAFRELLWDLKSRV